MAEGFLRVFGGDSFEAHSAGTKASELHPMAVEVMREAGIDISRHRSKNAAEYLGTHFSYVITVCDNAKESCPIFPGPSLRMHWPFQDPALATGSEQDRLQVFRTVRDQIEARVREFAANAVQTKP
jgi:arsenate reductase